MPLIRKRRARLDDVSDYEDGGDSAARRDDSPASNDTPGNVSFASGFDHRSPVIEQLARKLVRYALSCEYSRIPIRRADVVSKVLAPSHSRSFREVFAEAQLQLQDVFGMQMVPWPNKEKITLTQRRAAQKSEKATNTTISSWMLVSTLPDRFRDPRLDNVLRPAQNPTAEQESTYVGLYTFVVTIIYLNQGRLPESKLDKQLRRMNAEENTPLDRTDKLLQRMVKDGYIVRLKDSSTGEELIEYVVGPRGQMEVGEEGVRKFVKTVYGEDAEEDLDQKLQRSLALVNKPAAPEPPERNPVRGRGRPRRNVEEDAETLNVADESGESDSSDDG